MQLHRAAMELSGHVGPWFGGHDGITEVPFTRRAERVLTQESLTYRAGGKGERKSPGNVDAKVITGSWHGTGITGVDSR